MTYSPRISVLFVLCLLLLAGPTTTATSDQAETPPLSFHLSPVKIAPLESDKTPTWFYGADPIDLNGDGYPDLVYGGAQFFWDGWGEDPIEIGFMLNDQKNGFTPVFSELFSEGEVLPEPLSVRRMEVADFNGDGLDDVLVAGAGYDGEPFLGENNILLLSQGGGLYRNASAGNPEFEYSGFTHAMNAGDINNDGNLDIMFVDIGLAPDVDPRIPIRILLNNAAGTGKFVTYFDRLPGEYSQVDALGSLLVDLNNDEFPEIVLGTAWPFIDSRVLWNDGTGHFVTDATYSTSVLPEPELAGDWSGVNEIATLDLDLDGYQDLILSRTSEDYEGRYIQALVNNQDGTFSDQTSFYFPDQVTSGMWIAEITFADLNLDGREDIILNHSTVVKGETQLIFMRQNDNSFANYDLSQLPELPLFEDSDGQPVEMGVLAPIDADLDGDLDLLVLRSAVQEGPPQVLVWDLLINDTIVDGGPITINAGHAGAWYNPDTAGQGQLIDVVPETQFMFLAWFTFTDASSNNPDQQHWYTAQGNYSGNTADLILSETLGGQFDDPQQTSTTPVGTATVSFSDCDQGQMAYNIDTDGREGTIPLQRLIPESDNVCEDQSGKAAIKTEAVDINAGMDGTWVNNDTLGQGFLIDAHPNPDGSNFIFVAWFTYGDDTASGQRWLTAQGDFTGSTTAAIDVYETTGGRFDDPQAVNVGKVGTMTIDFTDCSNATLTYSLTDDDLASDMELSRLIPGGQALCEELAGAD
jgi:hypothetical protein